VNMGNCAVDEPPCTQSSHFTNLFTYSTIHMQSINTVILCLCNTHSLWYMQH